MSLDRRVQRMSVGYNADVATSAEILANVAGGLTAASIKTAMTTASAIQISSSSADDDVAGTGALTADVCILDSNYRKKVVTVTLTGQTAVDVGTGHAVLWAEVKTAGSGGVNAGILDIGIGTVSSGSNDALLGSVAVGANRTQMAVDAADATGPITIQGMNYQVGAEITGIEIVSVSDAGLVAKRYILAGLVAATANDIALSITIPAKTLIYVTAIASANTSATTVALTVNKL